MKIPLARWLLIVGVAYAGASFLLYRARVQSESRVWDSDVLVLYAPTVVALAINGFAFWHAFRGRLSTMPRLGAAIGLAVLATLAAAWCWAFVAFNLYGT